MEKLWVIVVSIIFCSVSFAGPNNYIGIDGDGKVYELNYGANSGSLNIDEGSHYETYSTSGTDGSDGGTGAQGPRGERGRDGDDFNGDSRLVSLEAGFSGLYDYRPDIGANTLGIVGVTAINSIRYPDRNGVYLGVGTGYYRGQSSIAIGVSKRSDNVSINFNVSSTGVVGAGVVWRFK